MLFTFVLTLYFIHQNVDAQWRRYEPYWISTKPQAESIGVDLKRFFDAHCSASVSSFLN